MNQPCRLVAFISASFICLCSSTVCFVLWTDIGQRSGFGIASLLSGLGGNGNAANSTSSTASVAGSAPSSSSGAMGMFLNAVTLYNAGSSTSSSTPQNQGVASMLLSGLVSASGRFGSSVLPPTLAAAGLAGSATPGGIGAMALMGALSGLVRAIDSRNMTVRSRELPIGVLV